MSNPTAKALEQIPSFENGVQFNRPPDDRIAPILGALNSYFGSDPTSRKEIVFLVNEKDGKPNANAALIIKHKNTFEVVAWIGKSWEGSVEYSAMGRIKF